MIISHIAGLSLAAFQVAPGSSPGHGPRAMHAAQNSNSR